MPERNRPRLQITAPALADIEDIAAYTANRWGEAQARKYLAQIDRAIHAVAEQPESGKAYFGVPSAIKARKAGSHFVFYRLEAGAILYILRILHESMDHGGHLDTGD